MKTGNTVPATLSSIGARLDNTDLSTWFCCICRPHGTSDAGLARAYLPLVGACQHQLRAARDGEGGSRTLLLSTAALLKHIRRKLPFGRSCAVWRAYRRACCDKSGPTRHRMTGSRGCGVRRTLPRCVVAPQAMIKQYVEEQLWPPWPFRAQHLASPRKLVSFA